jgi:phospholipase C
MSLDRRRFLVAAASAALPPAIARARAIDADVRTGTIADIAHVVVFMQENRGFDHYFGAMRGVRGFADRFPVPLPGGRTVWAQPNRPGASPALVAPFRLDTADNFALMRVQGTPHNWTDAQDAWDEGRMGHWPAAKGAHAMGHYGAGDIPFQYALADAFTVCDAYHASMQCGTNSNRLFLFTGTNDPAGRAGGPSISNSHDSFPAQGGWKEPYGWTTYAERLQAAGVSWRVYQDMADNFTDNPLVGFRAFRESHAKAPGSDPRLAQNGLSTYRLDRLKADVMADRLPQVSWIVAPARASEHPGPSSPAQGADYSAQVLDALTANPAVWARTVLLLMFDENDGFFDHVPPPAPPSRDAAGALLGASMVDTAGEYHTVQAPSEAKAERADLMGRPYGLGPRVPMYVISPWSRGGWVNSEVFDHTSVLRFLEARFGVAEPNISPWRRAVCGDLTSAFDFRRPNRASSPSLPPTAQTAARAAALRRTTLPATPATAAAPRQVSGLRPSRALPYDLGVGVDRGRTPDHTVLGMTNRGAAAAVLHVYDLTDLSTPPRRYTLAPGKVLEDHWPGLDRDLYVLGPNGFHRRFRGGADAPVVTATSSPDGRLNLLLANPGEAPLDVTVTGEAYGLRGWRAHLRPGGGVARRTWTLARSSGWYDLSIGAGGQPRFLERLAGRVETGHDSLSDPAMHGQAVMRWDA